MVGKLVSVIIPVYDRAHTVKRAVDSVLRQTYQDFELLLVDDGSTDNSLEICRGYAASDVRIRVFHTENQGVSAARNLGIRQARGEYIRFVDSDDELPERSLEYLLSPLKEADTAELVVGCADGIDSLRYDYDFEDRFMSQREFLLQFFRDEFRSLYFTVWNKLYLRSVIAANGLAFNEAMRYDEDLDFNFRYYACVANVYFSSRIVYRVHHPRGEPGHLSGKRNQDLAVKIDHTIALYGVLWELTDPVFANSREVCAAQLMDLMWGHMKMISYRRDHVALERAIRDYDWKALLADLPLDTCFWAYRILYSGLVQKKAWLLFSFFYCFSGAAWLYARMPYKIRQALHPLVRHNKRDYDRLLEGQ